MIFGWHYAFWWEVSVQSYGHRRILEAVVQKCKADKTIDKSVVTNKDPKTKKVYKIVSSFVVEGHAALQQEIKSAFERDKEEAYQVIENENDGVVSWFIRFSKGKNTVSLFYKMLMKKELLLTVIENFDMPEEKDIEIRSSSDM